MEKFLVVQIVHFLSGTVVTLPMQLFADEVSATARVKELEAAFMAAMGLGVVERSPGTGKVKLVGALQNVIPSLLGIARIEYKVIQVQEEGLIKQAKSQGLIVGV